MIYCVATDAVTGCGMTEGAAIWMGAAVFIGTIAWFAYQDLIGGDK